MRDLLVKKGDLYFADLSPVIGSEQGGVRPVLVVQNNVGNKFSPTIIVAAVTSQKNKANLPTHVEINGSGSGLNKDSVILLEQLRTIDKKRLKERIGTIEQTSLPDVNDALSISLGIANSFE
ncbi:MAG: type II toxin-antitoxin system PemK/MazF family toxin [Anaerovoracaceae bacterium]